MEDLKNALQETANEAQTTPEPVSEATPTGNEVTQPATTSPEDDLPTSVKDYLTQNPNAKDVVDLVNREMKAAFTPKLQEAAKYRQMVEGLDEATLNGIRYLQQLAQTDPRNAATYLRQQAELLDGSQQQQQTPNDPYAQYEPATDVEAIALQKIREFEQWKIQQEKITEQQSLRIEGAKVNAEFDSLQQELGITVPQEERAIAWEKARAAGVSPSDMYFALKRGSLMQAAIQKARDEASQVVNTKLGQAAGNPAGLAARTGEQQDRKFKSFADRYRHELNSS